MSTATSVPIPTQRTADTQPLDEDPTDLPSCSFTGDPVPDMDDHALHCGECFAYHVQEN